MELAESLRSTLRSALESLKFLYSDDGVWKAAAQAVASVDVPTRQLVKLVAKYPESLPALLELFGYLAPPPAAQLVSSAVTSLQTAPADEGPADRVTAVNEARQALGQLLERALELEHAQPWRLPVIASETIPALDMGVTIAAGALTGGVAAAVGSAVVPAAVATGGLAVAPMIILGGIYRWLRKRKVRAQNGKLLEAREQLSLHLVPGARAAVLQHLDPVVILAPCAKDPQAFLDLSDHLEVLIDITRLFGVGNSHLRTAAKQEALNGNDAFPFDVLVQMPKVFAAARKAKEDLDKNRQIDQESYVELEKQLEIVKNLGPRFGKKPPKIGPKS
jgi:hypothetical protein